MAIYFKIKKIKKLVAKKYFWPTLCQDVKVYIKDYTICLASNSIYYKQYGEFQLLSILFHYRKKLFIDFLIGFSLSINRKSNSSDLILVIVNCLTKIGYSKPFKIIINTPGLAKVVINIMVR